MARREDDEVRHLTDIPSLSDADLGEILARAEAIRRGEAPSPFPGSIASIFYEPSTRTEMSFLKAMDLIGAHPLRMLPERSSVTKGESPEETVKTLAAVGARAVVIRTSEPLLPERLKAIGPGIVNAGDGCHEHPTQALLDAATLIEVKGTLEGLRVLIVGDHLHSRVSRSSGRLFVRMGARVRLAGPAELTPPALAEALGAGLAEDLEGELAETDVVMALRIQKERQAIPLVPDLGEYRRVWGITKERFARHPDLLLMHPGPANLGVEVDGEIVDDERSLIRSQVRMGSFIRAAVLGMVGEASI